MARITIPQSRLNPIPSSTGVRTPNADAFGAGVGAATQQAGSALGDIALDIQARENETAVRDADAEYLRRLDNIKQHHASLQGRARYDALGAYQSALTKHKMDVSASLPNDAARRIFDHAAQVHFNTYLAAGTELSRKALDEWDAQARETRINTAASILGSMPDELTREDALNTLRAELSERDDLPPETKQALLAGYVEKGHLTNIQALAANADLAALRAAKGYYQQHAGEIGPEARAKVDGLLRGIHEHNIEVAVSDIELQVRQGVGDATQHRAILKQYRDEGKITGKKYVELMRVVDKTETDHANAYTFGQAAVSGVALENSKKNRDAADIHYKNILAADPTQDRGDLLVSMGSSTTVLPTSFYLELRSRAIAGTPQQQADTAKIVQKLRDNNLGHLLKDLPTKDLAFYDNLAALKNAGVPDDRAAEIAMKNANLEEPERDALAMKYKQDNPNGFKANAQKLNALINDEPGDPFDPDESFFTGAFNTPPAAPALMEQQFEKAVSEFYYYNGGDIELARKSAWDKLKATWGTTSVDGKARIMRRPPEREFGVQPDVLRQDLEESLKANGEQFEDVSEFTIVATDATENAAQGKAVYRIYRTHRDGKPIPWEPLLGADNQPLGWTFSRGHYAEQLRAEQARQAQEAQRQAAEMQANDARERAKAKREYEARKGGK